jgi:hypothetical protein
MKFYRFGKDPFDVRPRRLKKSQFFPHLLIEYVSRCDVTIFA